MSLKCRALGHIWSKWYHLTRGTWERHCWRTHCKATDQTFVLGAGEVPSLMVTEFLNS